MRRTLTALLTLVALAARVDEQLLQVDDQLVADRLEAATALPREGDRRRAADQNALHDRLQPEVQVEHGPGGHADQVDAQAHRCGSRPPHRPHRSRSSPQLARVEDEGLTGIDAVLRLPVLRHVELGSS